MKFKEGNDIVYTQEIDHLFRGIPPGIDFEVKGLQKEIKTIVMLRAKGYGEIGDKESYGDGALFVFKRDVPEDIWEEMEKEKCYIK